MSAGGMETGPSGPVFFCFGLLSYPCAEKCVGDGKDDGADENADQSEGKQAADDAREDDQKGQVRASSSF